MSAVDVAQIDRPVHILATGLRVSRSSQEHGHQAGAQYMFRYSL